MSQLSIEVSSNDGYVFIAIRHVFLDRFVHFLNVMVRIPRVEDQFDALAVDHDCGGDGTFVDVFSVNYYLLPLLVQQDTNAVFSCTHENVFMMGLPYFFFCHASTFHTIIKHPNGSLRARKPFLAFVHLSALISHSYVAR